MPEALVTAALIRRDYLEPGMDARALNDAQARLVSNPDTPELDSLTERLAAMGPTLRGTGATPHLIHAFDLALELRDSNRSEGAIERGICGSADRLVTDLRSLELSGSGGNPLTAKALARALREPLRVIAEPRGDPRAWVDAGRTVGEIFARTPSGQLFAPEVLRDLGKAKAAALRELYDRRETKGAATPAKGRGATEPRGEAHGRSDGE
jgi:hypothetical protein